jgi:NTP pyrophosphatase (non-canonical NTP hydrolase)
MNQNFTFSEYQIQSKKTAKYPAIGHPVVYPVLGLAGESGEVADKIKKIFRDKNGVFSAEDLEMIKKELGDVLWYISQIATELEFSLEEIAQLNLQKLFSRMERGAIGGSGDSR